MQDVLVQVLSCCCCSILAVVVRVECFVCVHVIVYVCVVTHGDRCLLSLFFLRQHTTQTTITIHDGATANAMFQFRFDAIMHSCKSFTITALIYSSNKQLTGAFVVNV